MEYPVESQVRALRSWLPWRRRAAAQRLGHTGDSRHVEPLVRAMADWSAGVRRAAAEALGLLDDARAIVPLVRRLADNDPLVRRAAAWALAGSDTVRDAVRLVRAVAQSEAGSSVGLEAAMRASRDASLLRHALSGQPERQRKAILAESLLVLDQAGSHLCGLCRSLSQRTERVIQVLRDLDEERAIGPLVSVLCDRTRGQHQKPVQAALAALRELSKGREAALARAALDQTVRMDLGLSLRSVGRLLEGEAQYRITSPEVRGLLLEMGPEGVTGLFHAVNLEHPNELRAVANLLRAFSDQAVATAVLGILCGGEFAQTQAVRALWHESPLLWRRVSDCSAQLLPGGRARLFELLASRDLWARLWAADALGRTGRDDAVAQFEKMLQGGDEEQRLAAAVGLASRGRADALPPLRKALRAADAETRLVVAVALGWLGAPAGPALAAIRELQAADPRAEARRLYRDAGDRIEQALRESPTELEASAMPAGIGTELEAGVAPAGVGTELESGDAPVGRGTEPEAGAAERTRAGADRRAGH